MTNITPELGSLVRLEGIVTLRGDEGTCYGGPRPNWVRVIPSKVEIIRGPPQPGEIVIYGGRFLTIAERPFYWNGNFNTEEGVAVDVGSTGFTFPTPEQIRIFKETELAKAKATIARLTLELSQSSS